MEAFIVLLDVDKTGNGRGDCEFLENHIFSKGENPGHQDFIHIRDKVMDLLTERDPEFDNDALVVYPLTDFMDACNNSDSQVREINLMNVWVSYVYLK
jgi:hypothetical protein